MLSLTKKISIIGLSCLLTACMTTKVNLNVEATDNLNFNQFDEPLPVVLKVYQLTDIQAFNNASFEQLWKQDKSVLANSLLTVEERTVNPSQKINIEFEQAQTAKFVALVGLFRDRSDNQWRTYHDLNSGTVKLSTNLEVLITNNSVQIPGLEVKE